MLTFYGGGLPHFVDHLAPIYKALPDPYKGRFHARGQGLEHAMKVGIPATPGVPRKGSEHVVVASYEDLRAIRPHPAILVNHGAGQTYNGDPITANHPAYSGGNSRDRVALHLCVSERDARNCGSNSVAVGVPKMDPWYPSYGVVPKPIEDPVVAISFHADIHLIPETRWAFPHYEKALKALAKDPPFRIIGHSHPRMWRYMADFYRRAGIEFVKDFSNVLDIADVYVCDNSSTLYEFASTGRPVVVLNAPWYRRHIHHGLRFWDAIPGVQVDLPQDLVPGVEWALESDPMVERQRVDAVTAAYDGLCDGKATERAVAALEEFVDAGYNT